MNDNNKADVFWLEREKEIGDKILFRTMARIGNIKSGSDWTLFYGTRDKLFFQFFKNKSFFSFLSEKAATGEASCQEVDLSLVEKVDFVEEKNFLKIFNIDEGRINIHFREKVDIKSDFTTERCLLFPLVKVSEIKNKFPAIS